jgi:phosphatidylserine synthase
MLLGGKCGPIITDNVLYGIIPPLSFYQEVRYMDPAGVVIFIIIVLLILAAIILPRYDKSKSASGDD